MTSKAKMYSAGWLYGCALVAAACGAALFYFFGPKYPCPECPECPEPIAVKWVACFDTEDMEEMLGATDAWGTRFYLSAQEGGGFSALAAPIKETGEHLPDASGTLQFRMFKGISDSGADMNLLDETVSERAVKECTTAGREPWSLDVKSEVLHGLLAVTDARGIGLVDRRTTDAGWSFELAPVRFADGEATMVGGIGDILVGSAPCPMHCPKDPAMYLHLR